MNRGILWIATLVVPLVVALPAHASHLSRGATGQFGLARALARIAESPAGHHLSYAASNTNPASFTDPANDSGTAPDILTVVVSNDANGNYVFRITVNKLTLPSSVLVLLALDTDQNPATGTSGFEYVIACDEASGAVALLRWDGTQFTPVAAASLTAKDDSTGVSLTINKNDIGGVSTVNFVAESADVSGGVTPGSEGHFDRAPDTSEATYQQSAPSPVTLNVTSFLQQKTVHPGKTLIVAMVAARADTGESVNDEVGATVSCSAAIGRKQLKLIAAGFVESTSPEQAACLWRVPKKTRGKPIHGSITIAFDNATATRTFTARVK